jgi:hypothetical protein
MKRRKIDERMKRLTWLAMILLALPGVPVAALTPQGDADRVQSEDNRRQIRGEWKRRSVRGARLTAELPAEIDPAAAQSRGTARKQADQISQARLLWDGVLYRFAYTEYGEGLSVDLDRAADAAIGSLKLTTGVSDLRVKRSEGEVSGMPMVLVETTYQYMGSALSFRIMIAGKDNRLWQASALFRTANAQQEAAAKRVLDSVRLEK